MSSCSSEVDENAPIHTLPYETMRDLSRVLDGGDAWVELATWMPDITTQDVDGCRQFSSSHRGSPSEYLLRIWGSKGYSILSLYNLFAITRMVRCMRIIRHLLPESHHCLEEYDPSAESSSQSCFTPSAQQWKWNHVPLKARKESHIQHALPVRATGSTQKSWVNPTTTESSSSGNMSDPIWSALQNTLIVPYTDLQEATSNFSDKNIVGKGGYGVVYVGEWKHTKIAVKRFMANGSRCGQIQRERLRQSLQELRTLAKFRHDNILPLYAFSLEGPEPCLVYQFMFNGSLEDRLSCRGDTPPLLWRQKREIAEGTARGLHFLHSIASVPIIHGDVKSANILLDKHFEPKLGDFGLSRDGRVRIRMGSFIGMRAFMDSRSPPSLADYCFSVVNRQKSTSVESSVWELMDNRTPSIDNQDGAMSWCKGIIYLGLQCANKDRLHRPSFPEILSSLSSLTFFELSMSKRLRRQRSRTTTNVLRLDSRTFRCRSSSMVVMLLFPGERYCFYGAARIQCLALNCLLMVNWISTQCVSFAHRIASHDRYILRRFFALVQSRSRLLSTNLIG
ncbi:hypothetical protein Angca_006145 [Angiostrongylus cantonensis]|nr:hypothetical protein Angca_006145 [Angiostrongylus cantonensis]